MSNPAAIVIPAIKKHTATVIMLHGLGDTGAGWVDLAINFRRRQKFDQVSFIFPHAPVIPITVNGGMRMPGWYDIPSFPADISQKVDDEPGIRRTQSTVQALIQAETEDKGIPSNRIVLGGFSQGGAVSLVAGLTYPHPLAAIFVLSGYLPLADSLRNWIPADAPNQDTPIFMAHGEADPLLRLEWGRLSAETLRRWGLNVDFRTYPGLVHSADPKEIDDLETFLDGRIPDLES